MKKKRLRSHSVSWKGSQTDFFRWRFYYDYQVYTQVHCVAVASANRTDPVDWHLPEQYIERGLRYSVRYLYPDCYRQSCLRPQYRRRGDQNAHHRIRDLYHPPYRQLDHRENCHGSVPVRRIHTVLMADFYANYYN